MIDNTVRSGLATKTTPYSSNLYLWSRYQSKTLIEEGVKQYGEKVSNYNEQMHDMPTSFYTHS